VKAQVNGTTLYFHTHGYTRGAAGPMLLMHGGMGLDHNYLHPFLDPLGRQVELIYYDHRGNGRSQRPDNFEGITHETWVDDAEALRAFLGHDRIVLFGHSYGGFLAQEYALRYGDHLAALILCDTAPVLDYRDVVNANAVARGAHESLAALGEAFGRPMTDDADFRQIWNAILPTCFKKADPAICAVMDRNTIYCGAVWNHVNDNCLPSFNTLPHLDQITAPTLILSGADDWITPPAQGGQRLHEGIPNSTFVVFEKSGHFPFAEEGKLFRQTLMEWLMELS
jgi:proline iminopeptidase